MNAHVVIRADASIQIGSGHVMRCLTLADALRQRGARVTFICREHPGHLFEQIEAAQHGLRRLAAPTASPQGPLRHAHWLGATQDEDARQTADLLVELGHADCLVVDHYGLDRQWETAMRRYAERLVVVDDLADREHDCDVLLDQNYCHTMQERYAQLLPPPCVSLLGPKYALLRPEFTEARRQASVRGNGAARLFVFFGGSDPGNETAKTLLAIQQLRQSELSVDVVVGATYAHHDALAALCAGLPAATLHRQVNNMAALMARADLAIGAGGGTMWERCCLGLPSLVLSLASNQQAGCEAAAAAGAILYLGGAERVDGALLCAALRLALASPALLASMGAAGASLVDGQGARRVAQRLLPTPLALRDARQDDCAALFHWRNTQQTRQFSGNGAPIAFEAHTAWFAAALSNPQRRILIGESNGEPVGVLRFDRTGTAAVISVYLVPGHSGRGTGVRLIEQGSAWVARHWPQVSTIEASILATNAPSIAAFSAAGFKQETHLYVKQIGN